jgi:hypothetical protein
MRAARIAGVAAALALAGCSRPLRVVRVQPCPKGGLLNEQIPAALSIPRLEGIFIPPMPISARVRGNNATIRVVVDTAGYVLPDSVTICGVDDPLYAQRIAEEVSQLRLHPGLMNARHVVAPTILTYNF